MSARRARPSSRSLVVTVSDASGRPVRDGGLGVWLQRAAPRGARGRLGIALVPDLVMRRLNRVYRGKDRATDVLSFGQTPGPSRPGTKRGTSRENPGDLGDIVIAMGVARRQSRQLGHRLGVELRILALHGLLHLLGYDHQTDQGEMGRLEERLRRRAGVPVGLIARAPGRLRRR
jgi:probable rRNA maturation factor